MQCWYEASFSMVAVVVVSVPAIVLPQDAEILSKFPSAYEDGREPVQ